MERKHSRAQGLPIRLTSHHHRGGLAQARGLGPLLSPDKAVFSHMGPCSPGVNLRMGVSPGFPGPAKRQVLYPSPFINTVSLLQFIEHLGCVKHKPHMPIRTTEAMGKTVTRASFSFGPADTAVSEALLSVPFYRQEDRPTGVSSENRQNPNPGLSALKPINHFAELAVSS